MNSAATTGTQSFSFDVQVCHPQSAAPRVALDLKAKGIPQSKWHPEPEPI